jgi:hypothetical protein
MAASKYPTGETMPNPRNKAKATGDTHLPEIEADEFDVHESHAEATDTEGTQARSRDSEGRGSAPRGGSKAGVLKDRDAPTSDSYGDTRETGGGRQ